MTKLRCCFCQQELERNDLDVQMFGCENQNCKHSIHYDTAGTKELWKELIRTRKALDLAKEGLKEIQDKGEYVNPIELAESYLDEIEALEQKDIK